MKHAKLNNVAVHDYFIPGISILQGSTLLWTSPKYNREKWIDPKLIAAAYEDYRAYMDECDVGLGEEYRTGCSITASINYYNTH